MATTKRKPKSAKHSVTPAQRKISPKAGRAAKTTLPQSKSTESIAEPIPAPIVGGGRSKQDTVLGMLRQTEGTTIVAITEITGWKTHSVRGFFAGVVKKKLKLSLVSEKIGGERVYRIDASGRAA